ncbi:MAG: c-type cytochrome [Gammaproteobacteria bacterium]|nr:c-type cytochrome [Gammaproteobacteria bacterium]
MVLLILQSACSSQLSSSDGFALPEGDAENGQLVFVELRCIECHSLAGTEMAAEDRWLEEGDAGISVELGGVTSKAQSYQDLITSIINPSHRIAKGYPKELVTEQSGESRMLNYNEVMRVQELIDLVTFLKSQYELQNIPLTIYPYYIYPGG